MKSETLCRTPKHRDLIYDVGMHQGEDTEFYLHKGFRVVGFEALPENIRICRAKFADFLQTGQLVIVEGAIIAPELSARGRGMVPFYRNESLSVWGTVSSEWAERNRKLGLPSTVIEVEPVDFKDALQTHGVPHYLKIDIEGSDMTCISALSSFSERPDYVSLESSKVGICDAKRELAILRSLGYDRFQAVEQSSLPAVHRPPLPAREGQYIDHAFVPGSSGLFGAELPGAWRSASWMLRFYRFVHLGYFLVGDSGLLNRFIFPGAWRFRCLAKSCLMRAVDGPVPGWYDTHARHSSVLPQTTV
jgi:FkbM family methyltransferase